VKTASAGPCMLCLSSHSPKVPELPSGRKHFAKRHPKREASVQREAVSDAPLEPGEPKGEPGRALESGRWRCRGRQLLLPLQLESLYLQKHFFCSSEISLQQPRRRTHGFCCRLWLLALPSKPRVAGDAPSHRGRTAIWQRFRNGGVGLGWRIFTRTVGLAKVQCR